VVESSGLLNRRRGLNLYRGFESLPLRHVSLKELTASSIRFSALINDGAPEPGEHATLNCGKAVYFAAYKAGVLTKQQIHGSFCKSAPAALRCWIRYCNQVNDPPPRQRLPGSCSLPTRTRTLPNTSFWASGRTAMVSRK
jgi:hypothetical protein